MASDHASPEQKIDNHNQGQKDAAEGSGYDRPHGIVESTLSQEAGRYQEENRTYDQGYSNGKK